MFEFSTLELLLLAAATYLALISLVRLMRRRRDGLIEHLTKEFEREQERLQQEKKKEKRRLTSHDKASVH